jgi:hypothetical protein
VKLFVATIEVSFAPNETFFATIEVHYGSKNWTFTIF